MLASRLASRTIISSERVRLLSLHRPGLGLDPSLTPSRCLSPCLQSVGTQTSLSFETSSSIRDEMLAMMEQLDMEDQEYEESDKGVDGVHAYVREAEMSLEELREVS